jgi:sulfopropanediol 3-dehydrogenase
MAQYLKRAPMYSAEVSETVKTTVSEMLHRIDRDGADAIRAYSRELDGWDPASFIVDESQIEHAAHQLDPELREHIAFAQEQVRAFAQARRASGSSARRSAPKARAPDSRAHTAWNNRPVGRQ